ncbi:MAG: DUF6636 domain-containing protein [Cyanobacteria bacterium J06621_12]
MSTIVSFTGTIVLINNLMLTSCSFQDVETQNSTVAEIENKDSSEIINSTNSTNFVLPSKNIYCALVGADQDSLRCEIKSGLNPLPPQPDDCEFDWGAGFLLSQQAKPKILCVSDTIGDSGLQLDYETTWSNSNFECKSQITGLTCKNSSGQGFFLSREKWNIF